jgi:hypothetical protein
LSCAVLTSSFSMGSKKKKKDVEEIFFCREKRKGISRREIAFIHTHTQSGGNITSCLSREKRRGAKNLNQRPQFSSITDEWWRDISTGFFCVCVSASIRRKKKIAKQKGSSRTPHLFTPTQPYTLPPHTHTQIFLPVIQKYLTRTTGERVSAIVSLTSSFPPSTVVVGDSEIK